MATGAVSYVRAAAVACTRVVVDVVVASAAVHSSRVSVGRAVCVCACARTERARYAETDDGARRTVFGFFFYFSLLRFFHYHSFPPPRRPATPPPRRRPGRRPPPPFRRAHQSKPCRAHAPHSGAAFSSAAAVSHRRHRRRRRTAAAADDFSRVPPVNHYTRARAHTHTLVRCFFSRRAYTVYVRTYTFMCTG